MLLCISYLIFIHSICTVLLLFLFVNFQKVILSMKILQSINKNLAKISWTFSKKHTCIFYVNEHIHIILYFSFKTTLFFKVIANIIFQFFNLLFAAMTKTSLEKYNVKHMIYIYKAPEEIAIYFPNNNKTFKNRRVTFDVIVLARNLKL